ncbi:putative E3 ubiquitin-protein ligase UBR7 isoform X1 [Schistocerca americana]|uniref:putative E3 ubiquitin-protein ligase UBR7 isoform X1 n=1 Tax=Schistocerca americana TaxID=7009 RepID=UPI001F4FF3A7|nr:putative E3 ubiquitin-protein ligase UBR7 isoform X1 [Schistocerca americana]XP_047119200.1 putative E3 ubiquitin-protein ligase UBR7 isoform X1 [Schistocerca piceifrons]
MAESSTPGSERTVNNVDMDKEETGDNTEVTMLDVLKEELELEDDAKAVLGASDDKNCTYSQGYVKRQALYACVTCIPLTNDDFKPGGICLACSYHCHEGHELVELYTKRNFRCDCGNSRFPRKCNLEPERDSVNELNQYNQNFRGVYCTCHRPYPDPQDEEPDEMVQCIVCEDWFHGRHLGQPMPEEYAEMVCSACVKQHNFLARYAAGPVVNVTDDGADATIKQGCPLLQTFPPASALCLGAVFFSDGWRKTLCTCSSCKAMYESEGVLFLLDEKDTVQAYEAEGSGTETESQYERGMRALSSLGRVQQVEAIEGYNDMKTCLKEYLRKFADSKKVVRAEDIHEFFSGLEARKRQRTVAVPPATCH